jgi:superfamily II DNA helicase RecQ
VISISAKTGYGKSAIPAGIGSLRRGIVLTLVPLLGLGSDLVNKSVNLERGMEAYHVDEHRGDDAIMLADRLSSFSEEEAEHITIQLFVSPRSLTPDSPWAPVFRRLANRGLISVFCINEAHSIHRQQHFCPEFVDAALFMKTLYDSQPEKRPFVAMSATFRREDQSQLFDLIKLEPTFVAWTDMNRRRIFSMFKCLEILSCPSSLHSSSTFVLIRTSRRLYTRIRSERLKSLSLLWPSRS